MKKWLVVIVIIIVVAAAVYYFSRNSNPPPVSSSEKRTAQDEPTIKQNIDYAISNLRSIQTALESWKIDYKSYPDNLYVLTTPIAYVTSIAKDPFTQDEIFRYNKISNEDYMLWSVGPDGKDDGGRILFYERNGLNSGGDIVCTPKGLEH
ncbi:MAG: type II secretion system protein GspG [bacterium]